MIKVICDGCGKDITSYTLRYNVIINVDKDDFNSTYRTAQVCRKCKDKIDSILNKGQ